MNLLETLLGSMTSGTSVAALAGKVGASDDQIAKLIKAALPMLIAKLTKNASTQDGAASLLSALSQHTDTKAMATMFSDADEEDGGKILGHVLGNDTASVVKTLADETGMDAAQVEKSLGSVAPALLSSLSAAADKAKGVDLSDGLDCSDLAGVLSSESDKEGLLGGLLGGLGGNLGINTANGIGGLFTGLFGGKKEEEPTGAAVDGTQLISSLMSLMK